VKVNLAYGVVLSFLFSDLAIEIVPSSTSTHLAIFLSRLSFNQYSSLIAFSIKESSNSE
jgi:hypothetical protein